MPNHVDDPFRCVDMLLKSMVSIQSRHCRYACGSNFGEECDGWYLDGRASAVYGTHTHIQTSDERILPNGTAYITDVGMCGPFDSVIGMERRRLSTDFSVSYRGNSKLRRGMSYFKEPS